MLLGDDRNDPRAARSQMTVMVVVGLMMAVMMYFTTPQPPPPGQAPAPVETKPVAPVDAVAAMPPASIAPEQLPPVAEAAGTSDEVVLENGALRLVFTKIGARLLSAKVILGENGAHSQELVPPPAPGEQDTARVLPLGLRFSQKYLADALDLRRWEAQTDPSGQSVTFSIEVPGQAKVSKTFSMTEVPQVIKTQVGYTNLSGAAQSLGSGDKDPAFALNWGPAVTSGDTLKGLHQELIWNKGEDIQIVPATPLKNLEALSGYAQWEGESGWVALASAYFLVALKPDFEKAPVWVQGDDKHFRFGAAAPRMDVPAGETATRDFQVYIGPKDKRTLAKAWAGLDATWIFYDTFAWNKSFGTFLDFFAKLLLAVMNWFHDNVWANYGVAIIFVTILVRIALFPLTIKSMASMKKMQKLGPEMEAIKEKFKDNQQEQQQELMKLYRERGVNPISGCLPLLLQMPVFFAFYRMLWTAVELRRAPFFGWITDLSEPDRLITFATPIPLIFFNLESINLLPLLMAVVMWGSTKLMPTTGPGMSPEQKMVMNVMPVMFSLFCYNQAAGLSLYIITSTLLGMAQSHLVNQIDWDVSVEKKPAKAGATTKKHWFDAALEKKKQLEKEQKEMKKAARDAVVRGDEGAAKGKAKPKDNPKGKKK